MNYYAITINNKELTEKYKSIRQVYEQFALMPITVNIIAVERNELNENIHYHLLITAEVPITHFDNQYIWWKELSTDVDVLKYQEYIKKDGKYKLYNTISLDSNIQDNSFYNKMLKDCQSYNRFSDLIKDNPQYIKDLHKIKLLWEVIHNPLE